MFLQGLGERRRARAIHPTPILSASGVIGVKTIVAQSRALDASSLSF
jgi:hypothetical protein